jgi:hypothetical protein
MIDSLYQYYIGHHLLFEVGLYLIKGYTVSELLFISRIVGGFEFGTSREPIRNLW